VAQWYVRIVLLPVVKFTITKISYNYFITEDYAITLIRKILIIDFHYLKNGILNDNKDAKNTSLIIQP